MKLHKHNEDFQLFFYFSLIYQHFMHKDLILKEMKRLSSNQSLFSSEPNRSTWLWLWIRLVSFVTRRRTSPGSRLSGTWTTSSSCLTALRCTDSCRFVYLTSPLAFLFDFWSEWDGFNGPNSISRCSRLAGVERLNKDGEKTCCTFSSKLLVSADVPPGTSERTL